MLATYTLSGHASKGQKCQKAGHLEKDCRVRPPGAGVYPYQDVTCHGCGEKGHFRNRCPKAGNQQNVGARARVYAVGENPQRIPLWAWGRKYANVSVSILDGQTTLMSIVMIKTRFLVCANAEKANVKTKSLQYIYRPESVELCAKAVYRAALLTMSVTINTPGQGECGWRALSFNDLKAPMERQDVHDLRALLLGGWTEESTLLSTLQVSYIALRLKRTSETLKNTSQPEIH
ncbi:putative reverse transcriptase domain-containing protein [Tanacetum coccineum]|uniref:Reverse transcriptase domain-containing protein n=1 Tax=Tanacetum coccineum TaxID=301880 RepID=A0ABQ5I478_9ASTR